MSAEPHQSPAVIELSVIEPDQLAEIGRFSEEHCDKIIAYADVESARIEQEERIATEERKRLAALGIQPAPPVTEAAPAAVAVEPVAASSDGDVVVAATDNVVTEDAVPTTQDVVAVIADEAVAVDDSSAS